MDSPFKRICVDIAVELRYYLVIFDDEVFDLPSVVVRMLACNDNDVEAMESDAVSVVASERLGNLVSRSQHDLLLPLLILLEVLRVSAGSIKDESEVDLLERGLLLAFHEYLSLLEEGHAGLHVRVDLDVGIRSMVLKSESCCSTNTLVNEFLEKLVVTANFDRELKHRNAFLCGFS